MKNILIIDDDTDILNLYRHYLKDGPNSVDFLEDPTQALSKLQFKKYDLIITDVLMPALNGIELTKQIREKYPELDILVASEGGTTDAKEIVAGIVMNKAIDFGALFALKKPFKKQELLETIEAILNGEIDLLEKK